MAGRNATLSLDSLEGLDTMAEIIGQAVQERRMDLLGAEGPTARKRTVAAFTQCHGAG